MRFELTRDGARVVYPSAVGGAVEVFSARVDGSEIVRLDPDLGPFQLVFDIALSSDEAWVAILVRADGENPFELYLVPSDGSQPARKISGALVSGGNVEADFAFRPDSRAVLYRADQETDGVVELFAAGLLGSPPVKINGSMVPGGSVESFRIAPDGLSAAYLADERTNDTLELFGVYLGSPMSAPRRLNRTLVAGGQVLDFAYAGDRRVVYRAFQDSTRDAELYANSFGSGVRKLNPPFASAGDVLEFQVSPDGTRVVYRVAHDVNGSVELFSSPSDASQVARNLHPNLAQLEKVLLPYSISPDGRWVLHSTGRGRTGALFSAPIDGSLAPRALAGTTGRTNGTEAISPDSRSVVAVEEGVRLFSAPLDGSGPSVILREPLHASMSGVRFASPQFALFLETPTGSARDGSTHLLSVPIDGSADASRISRFRPQTVGDVSYFELSPSGKQVAYFAGQAFPGVMELFLTTTGGGGVPRRVNDPLVDPDVSSVSFRPDGQRLAFVTGTYADSALESAPTDGSAPPIVLDRGILYGTVWSVDGARVVYTRSDIDLRTELVSSLVDGAGTPIVLNAPLVAGGSVAELPEFQLSSDGRWVVYVADQDVDERFELYRAPIDGRAAPVVLSGALGPDEDVVAFELAPDSSRVLFSVADSPSSRTLYSVPLGGLPVRTKLLGPGDLAGLAVGSRSDRVVAQQFGSGPDSTLFSVPIAGGPATPLFTGPVFGFAVPAGGTHVVFQVEVVVAGEELIDLFSVPIGGGAPPLALNRTPIGYRLHNFALDPTGQRVAFLGESGLFAARIDDGSSVLLDGAASLHDVAIQEVRFSRDGSRLAYARQTAAGFVLFVVSPDGSSLPIAASPALVSDDRYKNQGLGIFTLTPDGGRLVYAAAQEERSVFELYSTTLDGPRTRRP
jgi:Tol biopolymer transport system component